MNTWIISLLVNNHFGVLTRVTGLFSRRGYNIVSLSVGETHQQGFSRITIQTRTDGAGIRQVIQQLQKLEDVHQVRLLPGAETVSRELLLVKIIAPSSRREKLAEELAEFTGNYKTVYSDESEMILEFTGGGAQCEGFLEIISAHTVTELCRTGVTAMSTTGEMNI